MKKVRNIKTQGSIKLRQYVDDLLRNKYFLNTVKKFWEAQGAMPKNDNTYEEFKSILEEYKRLDRKTKKWNKKNRGEIEKLYSFFAEEYGLDNELLRPIMISLSSLKEGKFKESLLYDDWQTDLCFCSDNWDEFLNDAFPRQPFVLDTKWQNHIKAFPVSIDIHRFATKRDLLDFIEKKWPWIENTIGLYRDYKNIKFRKRKLDRKLVDLIWNNKNLSVKDLKPLVDKKFPNNGLAYYEFSKIISQENKRRNRKIIVGQ